MPSGQVLALSLSLTVLLNLTSCDRPHTVSLTAEDFRFAPDFVRVSSTAPIAL